MMNTVDLSGIWECSVPGQSGTLRLPGTLDEAGFGFPDDPSRQWKAEDLKRLGFWKEGDPIITRLTRKRVYEGPAQFSRSLRWNRPAGCRVFLECERTRRLRLSVNGREAPAVRPATLSAPCVFDVTDLVTGQDRFVLISDNSYPGWPRDAIVYASAASDETQTNWNGILGFIRLRIEKADFISGIRVYPENGRVEIRVDLNLSGFRRGVLRISSPALSGEQEAAIPEKSGEFEIRCSAALRPGLKRWDLEEGVLYPLTVSAEGLESRTVAFGMRTFCAHKGRLELNGRKVFLRGETNCAVFPETGYMPADPAAWTEILLKYRSYGVNCVRFHSHCPPEAAFTAADRLGMLMQPELSHWDPEHAFASEESRNYYGMEACRILCHLANHPSFVMLSFGNELQFRGEGRAFAESLLRELRREDPTRLYTAGSNAFYGAEGPNPADDYYTASDDRGRMLRACSADFRGWLNREDVGAYRDYADETARLRQFSDQPVLAFEAGQYEVLPDFGECSDYQGITVPMNLRHMEGRMRAAGLEDIWPQMIRAAGENALACYRAEVEAAMRTEGFSGIFLLGLQDFPGQGTALVGMMNAHFRPKPYAFAKPERFSAFFRDVLPMAILPRHVFSAGEAIRFSVRIANYGRTDMEDIWSWALDGEGVSLSGTGARLFLPAGSLSAAEDVCVPPAGLLSPARCTLTLRYGKSSNTYPLWIYPDEEPLCPADVLECRFLDGKARQVLASGGKVFLAPDSTDEAFPSSVQAQFSPDFWSVCTFPSQSGCMGQLIDPEHPLFRSFPTDFFSSWQWKPMACRRAILLPRRMKAIVAVMDSCMQLRPMAQLFECRCGGGRLMVSSFGLHHMDQAPNVRALRNAVYRYMASDLFQPEEILQPETAAEFLPCRPISGSAG